MTLKYKPTWKQKHASREKKKHPVSKEVSDAVKALKNKRKAVQIKPAKGGTGRAVFKASPIIRSFKDERFMTRRVMPPEFYLLSDNAKRNILRRLTARTLYYCMSYLIDGVHWKGRIPDTECWLMEMGLRLLLRLRDSEELPQQERYLELLKIYSKSGGYSWTPNSAGNFLIPRQPGWKTRGLRCQEISEQAKRGGGASGALYWPMTWNVPLCPECQSVRCVDALTGVYYCWNQLCVKSRWNSARTGKGITSYAAAKGSLVKGVNLLQPSTRGKLEPESELVGEQLRQLLEQAGGEAALAMLKKKRI